MIDTAVTVPNAPAWQGRPYIKALDTNAMQWHKEEDPGLYQKHLSRDPNSHERTVLDWIVIEDGYQPPVRAHWHSGYEELFVLSGCMSFNSRDWMTRGSYCYHPPRTAHGFKSAVKESSVFVSRAGEDIEFNLLDPSQLDGRDTAYNLDRPNEELSRPPKVILSNDPAEWVEVRSKEGKVTLRRRILSMDAQTGEGSMLVEFLPGFVSERGAHYHRAYEEAFIVDGEFSYEDGTVYRPGYYMFRPPYVVHGRGRSEHGATVYISFGGKLEFLPA